MKKQIVLLAIVFLVNTTLTMAQGQGGGRPIMSVAERVRAVNEKLVDFKLDGDKSAKVDSVFSTYYTTMQKQRQDMLQGGGTPHRDAMRTQMMKLSSDRDDQLKQLFTDNQFKKWKDDIEPAMRPQRPNRQQ